MPVFLFLCWSLWSVGWLANLARVRVAASGSGAARLANLAAARPDPDQPDAERRGGHNSYDRRSTGAAGEEGVSGAHGQTTSGASHLGQRGAGLSRRAPAAVADSSSMSRCVDACDRSSTHSPALAHSLTAPCNPSSTRVSASESRKSDVRAARWPKLRSCCDAQMTHTAARCLLLRLVSAPPACDPARLVRARCTTPLAHRVCSCSVAHSPARCLSYRESRTPDVRTID
jgi:hypothetical protein